MNFLLDLDWWSCDLQMPRFAAYLTCHSVASLFGTLDDNNDQIHRSPPLHCHTFAKCREEVNRVATLVSQVKHGIIGKSCKQLRNGLDSYALQVGNEMYYKA